MTISTSRKRLEVLLLCLLLGCYLLPWRMYGREPLDKAPGTAPALNWQEVSGLRMTVDLGRVAVDRWRVVTYREGQGMVRAHPVQAWANTLAALSHLLPVLLAIVALPEAILLKRRPTATLVVTGLGLLVFCTANFVLALMPGIIFRGVGPPGRVAEHAAVWWLGPLLCMLLAAALVFLWTRPLAWKLRGGERDAERADGATEET
jgi:hypothetical protein